MQKWRAKKISRQQQKQQEPKFQIDTYFHVIQRDNGSPVLEDDLLMEQFDVLNEVYKETPFQFDLKDITRTQRSEWVDDTSGRDDELEGIIGLALRQGGPDTMNIYIQPGLCDAELFGYASLPRWRGIFPVNKYSPHDHVNICNDYLPGRSFPFDLGYTLVHEVGHWLGVSHPFTGRSCSPSNRNDMIDDTPQTKGPVLGCPTFKDSCSSQPGSDLVNNYMDYTDDRCMTAFTPGQLDRMVAQYTEFRLTLNDDDDCNGVEDEARIKFELQFDDDYEQTEWGMIDWGISTTTRNFRDDLDYNYANQYVVYQDCLPTKSLYEFFVDDFFDGGFQGIGYAALTVNGRELLRASQFALKETSIFVSAGPAECSTGSTTRVFITIFFDDRPEEVIWTLRNADTNEVVDDFSSSLLSMSDAYHPVMANSPLHIDRCLATGRYELTFEDSAGDGISEGGYWRVATEFVDLAEGGSFGFFQTRSFSIGPNPSPSQPPSPAPTSIPTKPLSIAPPSAPSTVPLSTATLAPSATPSLTSSSAPSTIPSSAPFIVESLSPSKVPSQNPPTSRLSTSSVSPTEPENLLPSPAPSTEFPSGQPTESQSPSGSFAPSSGPSNSMSPSESTSPSLEPTEPKPTVSICFSGDTIVVLKGKGATKLSNTRIGDLAMVDSGRFEPIYSFGHYSPNSQASFLELKFKLSPSLHVSKDHMIFVSPHVAIPASMLRAGDTVVGVNGERALITSIKKVITEVGMFAPFTPSGKIVVNGILASSFVAFGGSAHLILNEDIMFSYQWIAHSFEFPHRLMCHHLMSCPNETYTRSGISTWVALPHSIGKWLLDQQPRVRLPLLLVLLVVLALFNACSCTLQAVSTLGLYILLLICALRYVKAQVSLTKAGRITQ